MTKLYKPIIKPPAGRGYEGDDPWESTPTYAPYEFSFIQLKEFPRSYFWTWGVWAWLQRCGPEVIDELHADGWRPWEEETIPYHFYAHNQGAQILMVEERDPAIRMRDWLRADDLEHAHHYPVALSHQSPQKDFPGWIPPDFAIGSCALVKDGEDSRVYRIEQLGEDARNMQARIQRGLALYEKPEKSAWADERRKRHLQRLELWEDVHQAAQQLAERYWQFHIISHAPAPTVQNIFAQGVPAIPVSIVVKGTLAAFSNAQSGADAWQQDDELPYYAYQQGKDTARIEFRPDRAVALTRETLWTQIRRLGDLDGDIFLALVAQWYIDTHDDEGYCWISSDTLLDYRSIKPRTYRAADGQVHLYQHRFDDLKDIAEAIENLRNTYVTVRQWTKEIQQSEKRKRGRPKKEYVTQHGYIIQIDEFLTHGLLFDSGSASEPVVKKEVNVAWKFKPGNSLEPFLRDTNLHLAPLLQQSLNFDPVKQYREKRISRFLIFNIRLKGGPQSGVWRIRDLFKELSIPTSGDKSDRIRSNFEKALTRLQQGDSRFPFAPRQLAHWSYQEDLSSLPAKNWLDPWLDYHICLSVDPLSTPGTLEIKKSDKKRGAKGT